MQTLNRIPIILLLLCFKTSIAQYSEKDITAHILSAFKKIAPYNSVYDFSDYKDFDSVKAEKLTKENEKLSDYIDDIFTHVPATLHMKFTDLRKHNFSIVTSDDSMMRAYQWETMVNDIDNLFIQFKVGDSVGISWVIRVTEDMYHPGIYSNHDYKTILSIPTLAHKTIYLLIYDRLAIHMHSITSFIEAYTIEKNELVAVPFFKTSKTTLDAISYRWDGQADPPNANSQIHLSSDKQKLYIPVVLDNSVTKKYLVYRFDGYQFVFENSKK